MLLLASTSDLLRVITTTTSAIDVQVSAMDMDVTSTTARPTGYRKNTAIVAAGNVPITDATPSASIIRTVKTVSIRNKGLATNVVTVLHTDGTTAVECIEAALGPDTSLQYHENRGWYVTDSQGREVVANYAFAGNAITDADAIVRLTADVVNNNATANTIQDVTGLSFPVNAGKLYWFEFNILFAAAATTTGSRWAISGPAAPTYLNYISEYSLTTTTTTRNALIQAYDTPAASNASSAALANNWALITGVIQPSASGTVIARFASEILSSAITAKAESFVRYRQITP